MSAIAESNGEETEEAPSIAECPKIVENGLPEVDEQKHLGQIERDLDALSLSGTTINELEIQLVHSRGLYKRTLEECKQRLEGLRRRLNTSIQRSEPFLDVYRRAREVQEASNRAAARFDKANSQHAAAKEMINVAEQQLGDRLGDPSSPSALDLAWQEMLNHATGRVVETEKERRDSELEHKQVLEQCTAVMEEYRAIERKLRSHIVKSKPYFEERYRCQQRLLQIRHHIQGLEKRIVDTKRLYATTLKRLETLNTEIHARRRSVSVSPGCRHRREGRLDGQRVASSPDLRGMPDGGSDTESLDSLQLGGMKGEFTGSTGSLPSIGTSSVSDYCPTPDPNGKNGSGRQAKNGENSHRGEGNGSAAPRKHTPAVVAVVITRAEDSNPESGSGIVPKEPEGDAQGGVPIIKRDSVSEASSLETALAQEVVRSCLERAAAKLQLEISRTAQRHEEQDAQTRELVTHHEPASHGES